MALPTIFAGLRIAASSTVGIAGFAFFAGAGGLGGEIFADPAFRGNVVTASLLMVLLADGARADRARGPAGLHPLGAGGGLMTRSSPRSGPSGTRSTSSSSSASRRPAPSRSAASGEIWELTWTHLQLSLAATLIATLIALPIGVWLGPHRPLPVPRHQHLEHRPRGARARAGRVLHRLPRRRLPQRLPRAGAARDPADHHQRLRGHPGRRPRDGRRGQRQRADRRAGRRARSSCRSRCRRSWPASGSRSCR